MTNTQHSARPLVQDMDAETAVTYLNGLSGQRIRYLLKQRVQYRLKQPMTELELQRMLRGDFQLYEEGTLSETFLHGSEPAIRMEGLLIVNIMELYDVIAADAAHTDEDDAAADDDDDEPVWFTPGIPYALEKATADPFEYALGLRTGQVIVFESARLSPDNLWVHLAPLQHIQIDGVPFSMSGNTMPFERGLDVRVSDIVWVADAPWGS